MGEHTFLKTIETAIYLLLVSVLKLLSLVITRKFRGTQFKKRRYRLLSEYLFSRDLIRFYCNRSMSDKVFGGKRVFAVRAGLISFFSATRVFNIKAYGPYVGFGLGPAV